MRYDVLVTEGAQHDLDELVDYISRHDSVENAARVLDRIELTLADLEQHPSRGSYPKELLELGIREYRQIFFKPYRLIYRVTGRNVYIHLIVEGRRDLQSLLARRLLGSA